MIYGLIPVGGKGTRLALPFSKEMLPQKHYDYYNPVINHTVEKMFMAGASCIYMVHGEEFKHDITSFYRNDPRIFNIKQTKPSFAGIFNDYFKKMMGTLNSDDKILIGLPDSVYDGNPFVEMLTKPGIVCGMFYGDPSLKVDRPKKHNNNLFDVKSEKTLDNDSHFWGILKLDVTNLENLAEKSKSINEIGTILSQVPKTYVYGKDYLDLGTWAGYNKYITSTKAFSNTEIEKKYEADNIDVDDFKDFCHHHTDQTNFISILNTTDYYYTNNNNNIEFIRYRDGGTDPKTRKPNITLKNFNTSQFNRFELTIPLEEEDTENESVLQFLSLMGAEFNFSVSVDCHISFSDKFILVLYSFNLGDKKVSLLEIELKEIDFSIIANFENVASRYLVGFDPSKTIKTSKFQIIREYHDKNRS